ncbi:MAG: FAD/NAD(P)-binding protein [Actinobacteria bacterium]|nr:FAD/NAD(P)-binding protein [Actinomycetota bacterium]
MVMDLNVKVKTESIYVPDIATITDIKELTATEKQFIIKIDDEEKRKNFNFLPGQFVELTAFGIGEAPFSIPSSPNNKDYFELCVRNIGSVSAALHRMKPGDKVGIKGPLGKGYFPFEKMMGNNVVIIAGGLGMAPVRSLLLQILEDRKSYKDVTLIYGCVDPQNMLYKDEIENLKKSNDIKVLLTVDRPDDSWNDAVGVCTNLIPQLKYKPEDTYLIVCGPPVMYKFVIIELEEKEYKPENIFLSLERRMECGVGKCNHCHIGNKLVCVDGPVFSLWEIKNLKEAI